MTPAGQALARGCDRLPATTLQEVMQVADLQTRIDRKYLVPAADFTGLLAAMSAELLVLQIDHRRLFGYESVYFDTPDRLAYHQHAHGRRNRFKVRTRTYLDTAQTVLEVKTEGGRGQTTKDRHPYLIGDRRLLTPRGRRVVAATLGTPQLAEKLERSLTTGYHRATLLHPATGSRVTCDVDLTFEDDQHTRHGPADTVLIESKTAGAAAPVDAHLWRMGHRPVTISKYCAGLALLHPELPANRWSRTLRRHFGWHPTPAAGQAGSSAPSRRAEAQQPQAGIHLLAGMLTYMTTSGSRHHPPEFTP